MNGKRLAARILGAVLVAALGIGGAEASGTPEDSTVTVHLVVEGDSRGEAEDLEGRLLARPVSGADSAFIAVDLGTARSVALDLPRAGNWQLGVEAPGYWSAGALVWPGRDEVVLRLRPTGTVAGKVAVPKGAEPPVALDLRFAPAGELGGLESKTSPRHGSVVCPVDAEGRWRCVIPAGVGDLHLHATGFASLFRFDVAVEPGGRTDLGKLALRPGASIVGSVDLASARGAEAPVRVELTAFGRGEVSSPRHPRLAVLAESTVPDERGFFQFRDLRPGVYRLRVGADGLAPAVLERVEVLEGRESRILHPLALSPLASFELSVRPSLPPRGERWKVRLLQPEISTETVTGIADGAGTWRRDDLRPGSYLVRVETGSGTIWHQQRYEIAGDTPPLEVELPLVPIEGRLTLDGEPMRARLLFHASSGGGLVGVVSDLEGHFSGHLPRPGQWRLARLGRRGEAHALTPVEVERRDDGQPTWLEIELPETRLKGQVVDARGQPVDRASVSLLRSGAEGAEGASEAKTDDAGRFSFRGLREGDYAVDVLAGRFGSARQRVRIREGREAEVELRLVGEAELKGRVLGPDGRPVAAAEVYAYPRLPRWRRVGLVQRSTGPSGEFELSIPYDALRFDLLVLPPGFAARLLQVPFDPGIAERSLDLTVDTLGGTLHLRPGGSQGEVREGTLQSGGAAMFFPPLRRWARLHGSPPTPEGGWWLPHFAPGTYRLCSSGGSPCAAGELTPGGVLVLETPSAGEAREEPDPEIEAGRDLEEPAGR